MSLEDLARALTAESLNGGGWRTPDAVRQEPTDDNDVIAGRRRLRELMQAAGDTSDDTDMEAV